MDDWDKIAEDLKKQSLSPSLQKLSIQAELLDWREESPNAKVKTDIKKDKLTGEDAEKFSAFKETVLKSGAFKKLKLQLNKLEKDLEKPGCSSDQKLKHLRLKNLITGVEGMESIHKWDNLKNNSIGDKAYMEGMRIRQDGGGSSSTTYKFLQEFSKKTDSLDWREKAAPNTKAKSAHIKGELNEIKKEGGILTSVKDFFSRSLSKP